MGQLACRGQGSEGVKMPKRPWQVIAQELATEEDHRRLESLAAGLHEALETGEKNQSSDVGYLLDTNVVSELRKPKPHGAVLAWANTLSHARLFLSAVTIGELQAGVERTRRQNIQKAIEIEKWIEQLAGSYGVLPMDALCFCDWARLMDRKPESLLEDMMIAATARVHQLTLATRNVKDFSGVDLRLINPFVPQ